MVAPRTVADAPRHELYSLARYASITPIRVSLGAGTAGVTSTPFLPPGFSIARTGVGTYTITMPKGYVGANWGVGTDTQGGRYIFTWTNVATGTVVVTRSQPAADPTSAAEMHLIFLMRKTKEQ